MSQRPRWEDAVKPGGAQVHGGTTREDVRQQLQLRNYKCPVCNPAENYNWPGLMSHLHLCPRTDNIYNCSSQDETSSPLPWTSDPLFRSQRSDGLMGRTHTLGSLPAWCHSHGKYFPFLLVASRWSPGLHPINKLHSAYIIIVSLAD